MLIASSNFLGAQINSNVPDPLVYSTTLPQPASSTTTQISSDAQIPKNSLKLRPDIGLSTSVPFAQSADILVKPPQNNPQLVTEELTHHLIPTYFDLPQITKRHYQQIIGCINYLVHKLRPDIRFYCHVLARYQQSPTQYAYYQALHLLQYIYHTRDSHMLYPLNTTKLNTPVQLSLYTDASYNDGTDSFGGYFIYINGYYLTSHSFRNTVTVTHSFGSELVALHNGIISAVSIRDMLLKLQLEVPPVQVFTDNQPLLNTVSTQGAILYPNKLRNRIQEVREFFLITKEVTISHIPGQSNPADILTKALNGTKLQSACSQSPISNSFKLITSSTNNSNTT